MIKQNPTVNIYVILIIVIAAPFCLFTGSIVMAYAYLILYSALVIIGTLFSALAVFVPERVGMRMALGLDEKGHKGIDISVWDTYIKNYENRYGSLRNWLYIGVELILIAMFISAGAYLVVYIVIFSIIVKEASLWRVYKAMKRKKTIWKVAAFLHGIQESFEQ